MLNAEAELKIIKHLAEKAAGVPECGHILLPVYFVDKADFHAQVQLVALTSQKQIEEALAAYTVISYLNFTDLDDGAEEGSVLEVNYSFEIFREMDYERLDESLTPDAFNKKVLKTYRDFVAAIVGLREEFRAHQPIPDLADDFAEAETSSLVQDEFIRRNEESEFVPGVRGFSATLVGKVTLVYAEC